MEKLRECVEHVERNTLKSTRDALRNIYEIATTVDSGTIEKYLREVSHPSSRYLLSLFLSCAYINEGKYAEALELSQRTLREMENVNTRALDGVIAGLWSTVRIAGNITDANTLRDYLVGLSANREYQNVESITVLVNNILMYLRKKDMYDEAYTFLKHVELPETADVGQAAVFYYLSSVVYLMAGEYSLGEKMVNLATVKSTDSEFTKECRKVHVLVSLHQGRHPNRAYFQKNPGLEVYQRVLLSIKSCSLEVFCREVEEIKEELKKDGLYQAVVRLEAAVQKEHVRRIGVVYTRISLASVGGMLGVSEESAAFLLQKAIEEGAISGYINRETREYLSLEKKPEIRTGLKIGEMLSIANNLTMLKKHEPIKKKSLEEMQTEMSYSEYQI